MRSFVRIDTVLRVSIVILLSSIILPLLPEPADARSRPVVVEAQFSPAQAEPGETSAVQFTVSTRRFGAPVTVSLEIGDERGQTIHSESWSDVRLPNDGQAVSFESLFTVPEAAANDDRYVASVRVNYRRYLLTFVDNAAELRVVAEEAPSRATREPTATQARPTAAPLPPTATPMPPTATATPQPTVEPTATTEPTAEPTATTEPTAEPTPTTEPTEPPVSPPSMQLPGSSSSILRVNSGGGSYVDSRGLQWRADSSFSGGGSYSVNDPIAATSDDTLYASERWGTFSYTSSVVNGHYDLRLLFAEIWFTQPGQRYINVSVNGQAVLSNFDILSQTSRMTAYDVIVPVEVSNGTLQISVTSSDQVNGKLAGFELLRSDAISVPTEPTPSPTATPSPTPSPTATPSPTPSPTATATSTPVPPGATIQSLIDAASPNSTVRVPAGTYREKIYINKPIRLIADPGVIIDGENRDRWIVGQADNVTIEGFTFINSNQPQYHGGLSNDGYDNWTIRNNTFRNAGNAAIDIKEGSGHLIENNTVTNAGNVGIRVESVGSATIRGNLTEGNNTKGLDPGWEAGGMKITGNYGGVHNVVIENNIARDNDGPGIWVDIDGNNIEIRNNRVYDNTRAGIIYELSFGGKIHGNVVYNNATGWDAWGFGAGIMVQNSSDTEVYDNIVAWNPDGITVISQNRGQSRWNNVTGNTVHDNTIIAEHDGGWNTYGLAWLEDWNGVLADASSNNRGYGNRFWYSTPDGSELRYRWGSDGYWSISSFSNSPGGQASVMLSDSQKNQVLASAGL